MTTFWLSFTDPSRPKGQQFLGVAVVDVTDEEIAASAGEMRRRHPHAKAGAERLFAAMLKTHALGINPGGEILSTELPADYPGTARTPRNRLLSLADLQELQLV